MRTLVIGDIHGALKALKQVLKRCEYNLKKDKIIFLGDYVDGWSESAQLIDYLITLEKEAVNKPIFIKGNHDVWCEEWLITGAQNNIWRQQGGKTTINSYIKTGLITEDSHKQFFKYLHNYYIDDENRGFVHGGYTSKKGLGHELYHSNYYWDRDLWQLALLSHDRIYFRKNGMSANRRFEKHKEVYIGHTSTSNWNYKFNGVLRCINDDCKVGQRITTPINACNVWNLDTGCGYNGKLTIMNIDTKEFWQSDLVQELYPNELERN